MPANSPRMFPKLINKITSIMKKVMRKPNSSRMRSLKPLPVTAPIRAQISWTTISANVTGIIVQRS